MIEKLECTCIDAYKTRKMRDPNCCACSCDHNDLVEQLAKANERVRELEAHNALLMQASWEMKEGKPDAFYKIKDARSTEPSDALNKFAIEKKVEALDEVESVYMQAAETSEPISFREAFDTVEEQLRKEQDNE